MGYACDSCFVKKHEAQGHWLFDQSKKMIVIPGSNGSIKMFLTICAAPLPQIRV